MSDEWRAALWYFTAFCQGFTVGILVSMAIDCWVRRHV